MDRGVDGLGDFTTVEEEGCRLNLAADFCFASYCGQKCESACVYAYDWHVLQRCVKMFVQTRVWAGFTDICYGHVCTEPQTCPWLHSACAAIRTLVQTCLYTCVHTYACITIYMHADAPVCMHVYMHVYVHACAHVYPHVCTYVNTSACLHTSIHMPKHMPKHMPVHMF